jgi:hypothetical protein
VATLGALAAVVGALALGAPPPRPAPPPPLEVQPLFDIATTGGEAASTWATLAYDRGHDELFAVHGGVVHVYNASAMETFAFGGAGDGEAESVGAVERLALLEGGDLLLLTRLQGRRTLLRADFRGERRAPFVLAPLPAGWEGFDPDRLQVAGGRVFLAESGPMRLLVADAAGRVAAAVDLAALVRRADPGAKLGMTGFWAGEDGAVAFTLPLSFAAWIMAPDRSLRRFGTRGSAPGKFNVAGAIALDEAGRVFVLDRLRSVVLAFDEELRFLAEFGYRGDGPSNLLAPYDLAVGNGKLFVSQARERGVTVFRDEVRAAPPAGPAAPPGGAGGGPRG